MKVLVTGAKGFIAKNLIWELKQNNIDVYEFTRDMTEEQLDKFTLDCEFVFHLAGINRPKDESEFYIGNTKFTQVLLEKLSKNKNNAPILFTSSIQAEKENSYGVSKKQCEDLIFKYGEENNVKTLVYRLPNVFGKWCKPNYNSVVATFCNNISRNLDIKVNDPNTVMNLVYIDDIVEEFINALNSNENRVGQFCKIPISHEVTLGKIEKLIRSFKESRNNLQVPNMNNQFEKKLYSTYLSYLPEDEFSYPLKMNLDERGSFTEFLRTIDRGQVSVNISKPGIVKGNHWHHTKNEKFLVVKGKALIQFRDINSDNIIDYHVNGENLQVVDIPPGYTHNIINEGSEDLVTVMWANEPFDPKNPDTYYLKV